MIHMAQSRGLPARMMEAVDAVNEAQKDVLVRKILDHFGGEARGQDRRHLGPGLQAPDRRHPRGPGPGPDRRPARRRGRASASTTPRPCANVRAIYGDRLTYCDRPYGALEQADALAIVTEWNEFRNPDFEVMRRLLRQPGHLRRPQPLRPRADGRAGLHLPRHRPRLSSARPNPTNSPPQPGRRLLIAGDWTARAFSGGRPPRCR